MKELTKIFVLVLLFATIIQAQWDSRQVLFTETATSDSFKTPSDQFYLSGLFFPDTAGTHIGNASHNVISFWVSNDPHNQGWQKLSWDGALYTVAVTSLAITLNPQAVYSWEWWKIFFAATVKDSVYFYPQFTNWK